MSDMIPKIARPSETGLSRKLGRLVVLKNPALMPARIFARLFLSALATILAIHFWRNAGR